MAVSNRLGTGGPGASASTSRSPMMMGSSQDHSSKQHAACSNRRAENTYRLDPENDFPHALVYRTMQEVFANKLENRNYVAEEMNEATVDLTTTVKNRVKVLGINRYKLIVFVTIGQQRQSCINFASRCVWNEKHDTYVEYSYKNGSIYAVGIVYGIFQE